MKKKIKDRRINFKVTEEMRKDFKIYCDNNNTDMSKFLISAINNAVKEK